MDSIHPSLTPTKHKNTSTSGGCSSRCTVHPQPERHHHTGVGYYTTTVARTCINPVSLVLFIVLA